MLGPRVYLQLLNSTTSIAIRYTDSCQIEHPASRYAVMSITSPSTEGPSSGMPPILGSFSEKNTYTKVVEKYPTLYISHAWTVVLQSRKSYWRASGQVLNFLKKLESEYVPLCMLSVLQGCNQPVKASALHIDKGTAPEVVERKMKFLNEKGLVEAYKNSFSEDDTRVQYFVIPDEDVKAIIMSWMFSSEFGEIRANDIFEKAVVAVEDAGHIGEGLHFPKKNTLKGLTDFYKTLVDRVDCLVSVDLAIRLGEMLLNHAT